MLCVISNSQILAFTDTKFKCVVIDSCRCAVKLTKAFNFFSSLNRGTMQLEQNINIESVHVERIILLITVNE